MLNTATLKTRQIDKIKQFDKNLLKHFETVQLLIDFNFLNWTTLFSLVA